MNIDYRQPLRVAINAQFVPHSGAGGLETVLLGLIRALAQLDDGDEEYTIISPADSPASWEPFVGRRQRIVPGPGAAAHPSPKREALKRSLGPLLPAATRAYRAAFPLPAPRRWPEVPISDGFYESLGCDVIHFAYQDFTLCAVPSVYNPHDLQHRHYPQFFLPSVLAWRDVVYTAGCRLSHTVVVTSGWVKRDVEQHYGIDGDKVQIIPWAPPTQIYADLTPETLAAAAKKFATGDSFALYPAMTYAHKNHIRLLEAIALLRDRDRVVVQLICTGDKKEFWAQIERRIEELGLGGQVQFPGMVAPEELRALYRLSQFVVVPTLFEAASGPLFEAWHDGAPTACSTATSLPEQAGDAALLFDPFSVESIADAVKRMATDGALRETLRRNGKRRLRDFSWERTARSYRAVYRRAAGRTLTEEDRRLLGWDWTIDPAREEETRSGGDT
jgi:glycosyltransferase involved in cell wall biosynthesis